MNEQVNAQKEETVKFNFTDDTALDYIVGMVPEISEQLGDSIWKVRLAGLFTFLNFLLNCQPLNRS